MFRLFILNRTNAGPTWWSLALELAWAKRAEEETVARCWSDEVLRNRNGGRVGDMGPRGDVGIDVNRERCRTAVAGNTEASPIRTGSVGIGCWHRVDAHQRTSVLAGFNCIRIRINPFICSQNKQEIHMNKIAIEPDIKAQQCTNSCPHYASKNVIKI